MSREAVIIVQEPTLPAAEGGLLDQWYDSDAGAVVEVKPSPGVNRYAVWLPVTAGEDHHDWRGSERWPVLYDAFRSEMYSDGGYLYRVAVGLRSQWTPAQWRLYRHKAERLGIVFEHDAADAEAFAIWQDVRDPTAWQAIDGAFAGFALTEAVVWSREEVAEPTLSQACASFAKEHEQAGTIWTIGRSFVDMFLGSGCYVGCTYSDRYHARFPCIYAPQPAFEPWLAACRTALPGCMLRIVRQSFGEAGLGAADYDDEAPPGWWVG